MDLDQTVRNICLMPQNFIDPGGKSMIKLLEESDYVNKRELITTEILKEFLSNYPNIVSSWAQHSDDKRCTPVWVLDGKEVFYLSRELKVESKYTFDDPIEACSFYIKKEIETLHSFLSNNKNKKFFKFF